MIREATTDYEAVCWGGPLDGETYAADRPILEAARAKPMRFQLSADPEPPTAAIPYYVDSYRFERVAFGSLMFGAWIVDAPQERREAAHETIIDGLNAMYALAKICGAW